MNEVFPIVVELRDEETGQHVSGREVYYDIRNMVDAPLSPPVSGVLMESTFEPGVYIASASIPIIGMFIIYATCSGFLTNTEEVVVNSENIYDVVKQTRSYNTEVEDVVRTNAIPTLSQIARNVSIGVTDYIITNIKNDSASNWDSTTISGIVYAWYKGTADKLPYKMSDNGL